MLAFAWWKLHGFKRVFIGECDTPDYIEQNDGKRYPILWRRDVFTSLWHWKLWLVFFIHDIGYLGKPNMDGPEGERHPEFGARVMYALGGDERQVWSNFIFYHSRFLAKRDGVQPSPLCIADKLALAITPRWLYLPMVIATGEAVEYSFHKRRDFADTKYTNDPFNEEERRLACSDRMLDRVKAMQLYMARWVEEHRDGRADTWTPAT